MTEADVIAHWRVGAENSLRAAKLLHAGGQYSLALFHVHLALEKALKALFMEQKKKEPPWTHDLLQIALQIDHPWSEKEKQQFGRITQYAIMSRYDDPLWAAQEATQEKSESWITIAEQFLSMLLP